MNLLHGFSGLKIRNRFLLVSGAVFALVACCSFTLNYFGYINVPYLPRPSFDGLPEIVLKNGSSNFKIGINEVLYYKFIEKIDLPNIKTIQIETSDVIQDERNSWNNANNIFSSVSIRTNGTTRVIIVHLDMNLLREAGWSDRMIAREISTLILQGTILNRNLYTSAADVVSAKDKAINLVKDNTYNSFVTIK